MEYIKHLIMLKLDLFMLDFYEFFFVIVVLAALFIVFIALALVELIRGECKERANIRRQNTKAFNEHSKNMEEDALRRAEMKV